MVQICHSEAWCAWSDILINQTMYIYKLFSNAQTVQVWQEKENPAGISVGVCSNAQVTVNAELEVEAETSKSMEDVLIIVEDDPIDDEEPILVKER